MIRIEKENYTLNISESLEFIVDDVCATFDSKIEEFNFYKNHNQFL